MNNVRKLVQIGIKKRLSVLQDPTEENKRRLAIRQREAKRIIRMNKRLWVK